MKQKKLKTKNLKEHKKTTYGNKETKTNKTEDDESDGERERERLRAGWGFEAGTLASRSQLRKEALVSADVVTDVMPKEKNQTKCSSLKGGMERGRPSWV